MKNESGFTLIELLVTSTIILILAALSIGSYTVYKQGAEYAKSQATLKNARTAMGAGELEWTDGYSLPFTQSSITGGEMTGVLGVAMPGGNLPADVRLGAEVSPCDETSGAMDRAQFITVEACRARESVRWQKFCGGVQIITEHIANPAPCS